MKWHQTKTIQGKIENIAKHHGSEVYKRKYWKCAPTKSCDDDFQYVSVENDRQLATFGNNRHEGKKPRNVHAKTSLAEDSNSQEYWSLPDAMNLYN